MFSECSAWRLYLTSYGRFSRNQLRIGWKKSLKINLPIDSYKIRTYHAMRKFHRLHQRNDTYMVSPNNSLTWESALYPPDRCTQLPTLFRSKISTNHCGIGTLVRAYWMSRWAYGLPSQIASLLQMEWMAHLSRIHSSDTLLWACTISGWQSVSQLRRRTRSFCKFKKKTNFPKRFYARAEMKCISRARAELCNTAFVNCLNRIQVWFYIFIVFAAPKRQVHNFCVNSCKLSKLIQYLETYNNSIATFCCCCCVHELQSPLPQIICFSWNFVVIPQQAQFRVSEYTVEMAKLLPQRRVRVSCRIAVRDGRGNVSYFRNRDRGLAFSIEKPRIFCTN